MRRDRVFGAAALAAVGAAAGGAALYTPRIRTMKSIRQLSHSGTAYDLYEMNALYSYDLDRIVGRGLAGEQEGIDALVREALPLLPVKIRAPQFGCSAFTLKKNDSVMMGRNYDFRRNTSAMLVRCAPRDGYRSIGFCALDNLGVDNPLESLRSRMACLAAPFTCLDGVNEKGVSIAVLTLDSVPTRQRTGKPVISTPMVIRMVLDRAATTQEAVALLRSYDMYASSGRDYHFYITDAGGNGVAVEYDCDQADRPMVVTPVRQMTNFFIRYTDQVRPNQKNGPYGHGRERYDAIAQVLDAMGEDADPSATAWKALRAAAQEPNPKDITSNTQWSIVFDNHKCTADIAVRRRWDDVYHAEI